MKAIPVDTMTREERITALNEVKVLSILNHPNIIKYYENFLEQASLMIVMEYAEGEKNLLNWNHRIFKGTQFLRSFI